MFRKILVGTDGSDTAEVAVGNAAALAERTGAELLVAHALHQERGRGESTLGPAQDVSVPAAGRSILEHVEKKHGGRAQIRTLLREGSPADVLLDVADEEGVDVVVVGNVGMTGTRRFLGSVPNNVAHHAPCHVLIVNTSWAKDPTAGDLDQVKVFGTLVMATDGSDTAERALAVGADLARITGSKVVLVHVGDRGRGDEVLEKAAGRLGEGLDIGTMTVEGQPAEQIVGVAEQQRADLIVVGNKGMTGAKRFLLGSVPNAVAHHAPCSVLIARTSPS